MFNGIYFLKGDYVTPRSGGKLVYHIDDLLFDNQGEVYYYLREKGFTDKEAWQYIAGLPMPAGYIPYLYGSSIYYI